MKTISTELENHLKSRATSLATLWRVTRIDGTEFFFTDHDADITFDGNIYESSVGYDSSAIDNKSDMSVGNQEITGFMTSDSITVTDLRAGLYDFATILISLINWKDTSQGILKLRKGTMGEVIYSEDTGVFTAELRSLTQLYSQVPVESYQAECRADLGDSRCKVDLRPDEVQRGTAYVVGDQVRVEEAAGDFGDRIFVATIAGTTAVTEPTYDFTLDAITTDGTAEFKAIEAWVRDAVVTEVTDKKTMKVSFPNGADSRAVVDWFKYGLAQWTSGDNDGVAMEISFSDPADGSINLFLEMPFAISVGDTLELQVGCDKLLSTCINKFDNVINFRGEPYVPGQDELLEYPDAR